MALLVVASCSGASARKERARSAKLSSKGHTTSITLEDWGLSSLSEVGFVSFGILTSDTEVRLAVYDIRGQPPRKRSNRRQIWRSAAPVLEDGAYLITHFDFGNYNRLGGTFSRFEKAPSSGRLSMQQRKQRLRFRYDRKKEGFTGFWIHLFDDRERPEDRTFLHTGVAKYLVFEIKGAKGGDPIELRIADRAWEAKGDSRPIGNIARYLPAGRITTDWQRVVFPLSDLPAGIEHEELATLVLSVSAPGKGEIYLRNLGLTVAPDTKLPAARPRVAKASAKRRAMWVWKTESIVADPSEEDALVQFCEDNKVTDLFLQLLPPPRGTERTAEHLAPMAKLIGKLSRVGVAVEGLDGDPRFALLEHHREVVATTQAVIAYNGNVKKAQRFRGVRFDNEPYLLPGFAGPDRDSILRQYLQLLETLRVLTGEGKISLAADIPFWFDGHNRYQEPIARLDGRPVSELVIDLVDSIAIMAYRTQVYGPDGVIAHSLDEIEYAERVGKDVFVALETVSLPDEVILEMAKEGKGAKAVLFPTEPGQVELRWFSLEKAHQAEAFAKRHPGSLVVSQIFEAKAPASKLTFHGREALEVNEAIDKISAELRPHGSLAGFAIHSYDSFRKMAK